MTVKAAVYCLGSIRNLQICSVLFIFTWITCAQNENYLLVRLSGGSTPNQGLVNVFYQGEWGTVCDDEWDTNDGLVVCKQLGYQYVDEVTTWGFDLTNLDKPIHIDNLHCTGLEPNLGACEGSFGIHNCVQTENAGVVCSQEIPVEEYHPLPIILTGGSAQNEGKVTVSYLGAWMAVCVDDWDIIDAFVVCKQLGYQSVDNITTWEFDKSGLRMDSTQCFGYEPNLGACKYSVNQCEQRKSAGVVCTPQVPTSALVRLVDGGKPSRGRIEVFSVYLNQWGTVCDDLWDMDDAIVVCRQLGFEGNLIHSSLSFGEGTGPIVLVDVECEGTESQLKDCDGSLQETFFQQCDHSEDIGVDCDSDLAIPEIRLANGAYPNQGRVEIYLFGQWGTVCGDHWDSDDAEVVCNQLGFDGSSQSLVAGIFGAGSGEILLDNIDCAGYETSIIMCNHLPVGEHNCIHSEDAGVVCLSSEYPNYAVPLQNDGERNMKIISLIVIPTVGLFIFFLACKKLCQKNRSRPMVVNNPYTPYMDSSHPTSRTGEPPSSLQVDLPPSYEAVMEDSSQYGFSPGQIPMDGMPAAPVTPPPDYTPETALYQSATESESVMETAVLLPYIYG